MKKQVKIINCSDKKSWYRDKVGEIIEVNKVKGYYGKYVYEFNGVIDGMIINGMLNPKDVAEIE